MGSLPFLAMKKGITDWMLNPKVNVSSFSTRRKRWKRKLVPIHHFHHQQVTKHPIATVHLGPKPTFIINDLKLAKVREWSGRQSLKRLNYSTKKSGKSGDKEHTGAVWPRGGEREDGQWGSDQTSVLQPEAPGFAFGLEMISLNVVSQGIIWTSGTQWSTQRRFSLKTLKDFGFGKDRIEDSIHFEVSEDLTFKPTLIQVTPDAGQQETLTLNWSWKTEPKQGKD